MKIFIDSARLDEIEDAYSCGVLDGVTTNPSLIKKAVDVLKEKGEKIDIASYIKKILVVAKGTPVSLEVTQTTYKGMVDEAKKLYNQFNNVANNVYIKIPVNPSLEQNSNTEYDGIKAIRALSREGIPVNCTLVFTPEQALIAAKAGASFVSPFAGRIDDYLRKKNNISFGKSDYYPAEGIEKEERLLDDNGILSGIDLIGHIVQIFRYYNLKTEVLAASLRNPRQVREAALAGADIATLPFDVIKQLLYHPKTAEGMKDFIKDVIPEYAELGK